MGEHLRLICEISQNNQISKVQFFIKKQVILTEDISANLISAFNETLAYKKEALFYKIIGENRDQKIQCIAKHFPFPMDVSLLILEDLSVDQFISGQYPLFDLNHCKIVLKNLAELHTYSLQLKTKYNFTDFPELIDDTFFSFNNKFGVCYMNASIETTKQAIDCYPDLAENVEIKTLFEQEVNRILENIVRPSKKFPNVFCHGDLWHNNILFKYEKNKPTNCRFVDFQELRYLPPVHDIQFLLFINTTAEFRQKYSHQLYEYYYEEFYKKLKNSGINPNEIFPFYDYQECCSEFYPFTKFIAVVYQLCHLTSAEFITETFKLKADSVNLYLGTRHQYFIPELKRNTEYREAYREVLNEFIEILYNRHLIREDCFDIVRRKIASDNYVLKNYEVLPNRSKNLLKITILLNDTITSFNFFMKCLNDDLNRKEVFIYQLLCLNDLLSNMEVINQVMPKCYYSINDRSIVLENLEETGFKHVDTLDCHFGEIESILHLLNQLN
ncbi:uncharacterized protein LOC123291535 [Chrysoperla carnea]|uniref:uncharacterized protein LOC123291535 n=1 Tax=Chrysoperla carnea TaxID=189513 RepID=UPI001D0951EC|nr:uncharacterized protein LOC123291535 [Chrysoperla carnea]